MRRAGSGSRHGAGQHALDVARDQVDLEVDPAAGDEGAERGVLQRVRNQVDAELAAVREVLDAVDRQADAVDRDRALVGQEPRQAARRMDRAARVDSPTRSRWTTRPMPSTWPVTRWPPSRSWARSAFSRLTGPSSPRAAVRVEALGRDVDVEALRCRVEPGHGHAGAVQRDAVARLHVVEVAGRRDDREALAVLGAPRRAARASTMRPRPVMMPVNIGDCGLPGSGLSRR